MTTFRSFWRLLIFLIILIVLKNAKHLANRLDTVNHLLLHQVKTHGNHSDTKEEVDGAKSNPLLSINILLIWCQVSKTNGCQGYEAEVRAETESLYLKRKQSSVFQTCPGMTSPPTSGTRKLHQ